MTHGSMEGRPKKKKIPVLVLMEVDTESMPGVGRRLPDRGGGVYAETYAVNQNRRGHSKDSISNSWGLESKLRWGKYKLCLLLECKCQLPKNNYFLNSLIRQFISSVA